MRQTAKPKKTILVVEDDEGIREGLLMAIEDDDSYIGVACENGIIALDWLSKNPLPSAIITDYAMLGDGAGVAAVARRFNIPIVMVTGLPEEATKALAGLLMKIPVFCKPFDIWEVLTVVDKLTKTENDQTLDPIRAS